MYTYHFEFFKPGKEYFTKSEILKTVSILESYGFNVHRSAQAKFPPVDKNGDFIIKDEETNFCFEIDDIEKFKKNAGITIWFNCATAEGKNGVIASIGTPCEELEESPEGNPNPAGNAEVLYRAASAICYGLEPYFAWCDHELKLLKLNKNLFFDKVGSLAWTNMFSREFVEKLGGLDKVLLFPHPEVEKMYEEAKKTGKYMFVPLQLAENPTENISDEIKKKCLEKFPGVVLR